MATAVIYCIRNSVNAKLYVGQARDLAKRWRWHRNAALASSEQSYSARTAIARAMRKHGFDKFSIEILETCADTELDTREAHWIVALSTLTPHGYNLTAGGNTMPRSLEVGAAISAANKGRVKTPEWRAKLSAAHKGKSRWSPEERERIASQQRGRKQSAESNRKRSEALKGRTIGPYSAERCAKIAATLKGRKPSLTARRPPGFKCSPETRARMSASAKARKRRARPNNAQGILFDGSTDEGSQR